MSEKKHKHHRKLKKSTMIVILILVGALAGAGVFAIQQWESSRYATEGGQSNVEVDLDGELKTVDIDGVTYQERTGLRVYLLMGIDHNGSSAPSSDGTMDRGNSGQADLEIVLVIDDENQTWQMLQINRDTMANIVIQDVKGNPVHEGYEQICLAHSYGSGQEDSDENQVLTVSNLLWNEDFDGYIAMNMDAIGILADQVGGVTVTVIGDLTNADPSLVDGAEVTLTGDLAETYVRARMNVADGTNLQRMERQKQFMQAFIKKLSGMSENDFTNLYDSITDYTRSSLSEGQIAKIGVNAEGYEQLDMLTIDGTSQVNEETNWNEYTLDGTSLQNTVLKLFYEVKES